MSLLTLRKPDESHVPKNFNQSETNDDYNDTTEKPETRKIPGYSSMTKQQKAEARRMLESDDRPDWARFHLYYPVTQEEYNSTVASIDDLKVETKGLLSGKLNAYNITNGDTNPDHHSRVEVIDKTFFPHFKITDSAKTGIKIGLVVGILVFVALILVLVYIQLDQWLVIFLGIIVSITGVLSILSAALLFEYGYGTEDDDRIYLPDNTRYQIRIKP